MSRSIAGDVAALESELESLRAETRLQQQQIAVLEFENGAQKETITALKSERDHERRRADAIKVLLDQAGSSLVTGIQKFNATERDVRLGLDEQTDPPPKFISDASKALKVAG